MRTRRPALIAMVVLVSPGAFAALCSCGRSTLLDDVAPGPTGPSSGGGSSGGTPQDASPPDGGILDDASPPPPPASTNTGILFFTNTGGGLEGTGVGWEESVFSSFYAEFDLGMHDVGCETTKQAGSCVARTCPTPLGYFPVLPGKLPGGRTVSAGTLALGGSELDRDLVVTPDAGDVYAYRDPYAMTGGVDTFFMPGDTLTVSASGGVVPAFTAAPVVAPQPGTLVTPQPESGGPGFLDFYAVSTSKDLAVQWSGGESGARFILQGTNMGLTTAAYFECTWDASLGQGVVPQSVLAPFEMEQEINGLLVWGQQRLATFKAGPFTIQESVLQYGPSNRVAYH
jgi:hypothetical protein